MLTANINLVVPPLNDNDVWWADAAAWTNYWADINVSATFDPFNNVNYVEAIYDNTQVPVELNYGGNIMFVPSVGQFQSLLVAYQTLNASYKQLRLDLIAAGIIANA